VKRDFQRFGKLVRTGGFSETAGDSFETLDAFMSIHSFNKGSDALQIAVAAAVKADIPDLAVREIKMNHLRAGAPGSVFHGDLSFLLFMHLTF
jgi:hypothetical protein